MPDNNPVTVSEEIADLLNLSLALANAVEYRFMAPDHGAIIWKKFLRSSSIDVQKVEVVKEDKKALKGGVYVS